MKKPELTIGFVALGCAKAIVDAEKMLGIIAQKDMVITADISCADVVVINTCGFIAPAKEEALDAIRQAAAQKKKGAIRKVIVAGCLSERMGNELFKEAPGIDAVVSLGQRDKIADIIRQVLKEKRPLSYQAANQNVHNDSARLMLTPRHWAYLRISEGCDRRCSFCTIPAIRGRFRSKPAETILAEAKELVDNGAVELSIIAQDSNYYGRDLKIKDGLVKLLGELEKIEKLKWIRLMYLYPAGIDDNLIEAIAKSEKILNYIDMPIQHINNDILKAMNRADTKEKNQKLIEKLRSRLAGVVLRTTVIAGFPGESDAQFAELVDFLKWAGFDALGCFEFYPEASTTAAELPNQIPQKIKKQRAEKIMLTQQKIAFEKNTEKIGQKTLCLIDSTDSNNRRQALGRYYGQAPHIDSVCILENCSAPPGQFIDAEIVGSDDYDLIAKQI